MFLRQAESHAPRNEDPQTRGAVEQTSRGRGNSRSDVLRVVEHEQHRRDAQHLGGGTDGIGRCRGQAHSRGDRTGHIVVGHAGELDECTRRPVVVQQRREAPLDDSNTLRFCALVKKMAAETQFMFISHNKLTMEIAEQLIGVTMQELGVSRVVAVDIEEALKLTEKQAA